MESVQIFNLPLIRNILYDDDAKGKGHEYDGLCGEMNGQFMIGKNTYDLIPSLRKRWLSKENPGKANHNKGYKNSDTFQ